MCKNSVGLVLVTHMCLIGTTPLMAQDPLSNKRLSRRNMRPGRLELPRVSPQDPKSCAYANSATVANNTKPLKDSGPTNLPFSISQRRFFSKFRAAVIVFLPVAFRTDARCR